MSGRHPARHLVVLGDALLDRDVDCDMARICPDAPAPVLDERTRRHRPGGAALAALLARDVHVTFVAPIGDDEAGRLLSGALARAGVEVVPLPSAGPTVEKTRLRVGDHTIVRLDRGTAAGAGIADGDRQLVADRLARSEGILISDYGGRWLQDATIRAALERACAARPLVWDPHPRGLPPVPGAWLATPNDRELAAWDADTGEERSGAEAPGHRLTRVIERAVAARARLRLRHVAATCGRDGAVLVSGEGPPLVCPAPEVPVGDACGAGDAFAAAAAAALTCGSLPSEAVEAAVVAASDFVERRHVDTWTGGDAPPVSLVSDDRGGVAAVIARTRARGGSVVMAGGCFDLLHAGHVELLRHARGIGDCLIVCLNSDASVRRLKGPDRPIVREHDRAAVLMGLGAVDGVVIFDEDTPMAVLERHRPDVFVKGGDYRAADLPEAAVLARWGGAAVTVPYVRHQSTTRLLEEARSRVPS